MKTEATQSGQERSDVITNWEVLLRTYGATVSQDKPGPIESPCCYSTHTYCMGEVAAVGRGDRFAGEAYDRA